MTIRIKVVGCQRYSFKGELFEKGFFYDLEDEKARTLLNKQDDYGRPYFLRVETPIEDEEMTVEETTSEELDGVKITRKRGRPRKNPQVRTGGDTAPLPDTDAEIPAREEDSEAGVEV